MKFEEEYLLRFCKPEEAEQDAPIIATLIREMAQEAHADHIPELPQLTDLVYSLLTTGFSEWIIAEVDKQPVGCLQINYRLSTWTTAAYAYLEDIYVQPNVRQLGIARSMVDYAYQRAEARSCAYVEIDVSPEATEALATYQQLKFEEAPTTRLRRTVQRSRCCGGHGHHQDHKQAHDHDHDHECCGGQGHHDHDHDHECCGGQGHHDHDHDHECCGGQGTCTCEEE
jgi:ribosomal protein S18 acetylase RimI-like enzyme